MIVDTSTIVAIIRKESTRPAALESLQTNRRQGHRTSMSAATYLELGIVTDGRHDPVVERQAGRLLDAFEVEIVPFDAEQAEVARRAYRDFGKGSGHPARLNFGDCFAYALASVRREPLLFVGDDFTHTDLTSAL